jgi:hypothetical protein
MDYAHKLGAKASLEWTEAHEHVLRCADRLWDDLRALWIQCRHEQELAEDATGDAELLAARAALSRAEVVVDTAFAARREWRERERRREAPDEIESAIDAACTIRRGARKVLYAILRRVRSEIRDDLRALWQERDRQMRAVAQGNGRRYRDLHDGVYNDVYKRFCAAARKAAQQGRVVRPSREHPARSIYRQVKAKTIGGTRIEREGKRARIEGGELVGTTWAGLCTSTASVRIEHYSPGPRVAREWGLLVIPADAHGTPLRLPVRLDHEPPSDALVKGIRVVRDGRDWHAVLSIQGEHPRPIARGVGTLYAGINWRSVAGGLRVLDGVDDAGVRLQVVLPHAHVASVSYADLLQSALDARAHAVAAQARLDHTARAGDIVESERRRDWRALDGLAPESWTRGTHTGRDAHPALLSARRVAGGDAEKQATLAAEILGDRAGRRWVEGARSKAIRRREDLYRRCARWIVERYARIVLAESDGQKLARREAEESSDVSPLPLAARRNRQVAAPYSLAQAIAWALKRAGGEVVTVPAVDCSHLCPVCGEETERTAGDRAALYLRCSVHGTWDRDHALAMALWRESPTVDRERWDWHAQVSRRSQAEIVRVDVEINSRLRGTGQAWRRLRYQSGEALAKRRKKRGAARC